jgi:uncharacterized membrane protein YfcA
MFDLSVSPHVLITAVLIMGIGSAFQAAVGIGLALFVAPLLALVEPRFIPGPMLFAAVLLAFATAYRERVALDWKGLGLSLIGLAVGTVVGAIALKLVAGPALPKVFGILILLAVVISVSGIRVDPSRRTLFIAGGAAGIMGTMVGIHGPSISLVFQNARPDVARAMLGAFFALAYVGAVTALAAVGLFGLKEFALAVILLPGVVGGFIVAPLMARFVNRRRLRTTILLISATSAVLLILR